MVSLLFSWWRYAITILPEQQRPFGELDKVIKVLPDGLEYVANGFELDLRRFSSVPSGQI